MSPTNNSSTRIPVLVLAAGASRRLGRHKSLLVTPSGESLLSHAIRQAQNLSDEVVVVAGASYPLARYRCNQQPSRWVFNDQWRRGQSAALTCGLRELPRECQGAFVMLVDQPLLALCDLIELRNMAIKNPDVPVAADYTGRPGVPAYLPRSIWGDVCGLSGDQGASKILRRESALTVSINGVRWDVDTWEDWQSVLRRWPQ